MSEHPRLLCTPSSDGSVTSQRMLTETEVRAILAPFIITSDLMEFMLVDQWPLPFFDEWQAAKNRVKGEFGL